MMENIKCRLVKGMEAVDLPAASPFTFCEPCLLTFELSALFSPFFSFPSKRTAAYQCDGKPGISPLCVRVCKLSTEQDT